MGKRDRQGEEGEDKAKDDRDDDDNEEIFLSEKRDSLGNASAGGIRMPNATRALSPPSRSGVNACCLRPSHCRRSSCCSSTTRWL